MILLLYNDDVAYFLLVCKKKKKKKRYEESRDIFQDKLYYTIQITLLNLSLKNIFKDKSNLIHVISFIQDSDIKGEVQ